jgi:hypothetical protein
MLIYTISSDGRRAKEHLGETILIEWNLSTPRSMFFMAEIGVNRDFPSLSDNFLSYLSNQEIKNKENRFLY